MTPDKSGLERAGARRTSAALVLTVGALVGLIAASIALGANSTVGFSFRCDGQPVPNQCPKATRATGKLTVSTHPDPLAGATRIRFLFDNDLRFRPWVVPKCSPSELASTDMAQAMAACGPELIGTGRANFFTPGQGDAVNSCILLFNGTNDAASGDPTIIFYYRLREDPLATPPLTCANRASNHEGDATRVAPSLLTTAPRGDYRTELDTPAGISFAPMGKLAFGLKKNTATSGYVKARCFDADHVWNLSTTFDYIHDATQTVNSVKACKAG
jgi:hypothetical protein